MNGRDIENKSMTAPTPREHGDGTRHALRAIEAEMRAASAHKVEITPEDVAKHLSTVKRLADSEDERVATRASTIMQQILDYNLRRLAEQLKDVRGGDAPQAPIVKVYNVPPPVEGAEQ